MKQRATKTIKRRTLVVGAIALTAVLAWWFVPERTEPRAREYLDYTACLFTGKEGIQSPTAAPVWAGMQDASLATRARVQYMAIAGPATIDNAAGFLAGLAQGRCQIVVAVGDDATEVVNRDAARYTNVAFYVVGGDATSPAVAIPGGPGSSIQQRVADAVTAQVNKQRR